MALKKSQSLQEILFRCSMLGVSPKIHTMFAYCPTCSTYAWSPSRYIARGLSQCSMYAESLSQYSVLRVCRGKGCWVCPSTVCVDPFLKGSVS
jgi:hypothetical protein